MKPEPLRLPDRIQTGLLELVRTFEAHGVRYALIGGLASGFRGRPRFTEDVDVLVRVTQLQLPGALQDLQSRGFELDVFAAIREWNAHHLVQIHYQGVAFDWLKPLLPCLEHALERATLELWQDTNIRIVSAEDLIVMKVLALRPQDALDIQSLLAANPGELDLDMIWRELGDSLPEGDERLHQFEAILEAYSGADEKSQPP